MAVDSELLEILAAPSMPSFFLLLLLAGAAAALLLRAAVGRFDGVDRRAWISVAIAVAAVRGVLGRADAGHLALYGVFAGLPARQFVKSADQFNLVLAVPDGRRHVAVGLSDQRPALFNEDR